MASIRDLPLPSSITNNRTGRLSYGWDENFGEQHLEQIVQKSKSSVPTISSHAIAHGCSVLGTASPSSSGSAEWIRWEVSFDHLISQVASTSCGDVIAAASTEGTISLMRGADGSNLATKQENSSSNNSDTTSSNSPSISFIHGAQRYGVNDILVILSKPPPTNNNNYDEETSQQDAFNTITFVSGIDSHALNSADSAKRASAARRMSIHGVNLTLPAGAAGDVRYASFVNGSYISKTTLRLIAADNHGHISIHDYDTITKCTKLVSDGINLVIPQNNQHDANVDNDDESWEFDSRSGIEMDDHNKIGCFFMIVVRNSRKVKMCWYDLSTLTIVSQYEFPNFGEGHPIVMSLKAVQSCSVDTSLAAAVALIVSPSRTAAEVHVIQCIVEKTRDTDMVANAALIDNETDEKDNEEIDALTNSKKAPKAKGVDGPRAQLVYTISCPPTSDKSPIETIHLVGKKFILEEAYAFRCKIKREDHSTYQDFQGETNDIIGKTRLFLAQRMFDKADALLLSARPEQLTSPFGSIHSAEVALWRFRHLLSSNKKILCRKSMGQATDCLRRLSSGAVSGGDDGVNCLLKASQSLCTLPFEYSLYSDESTPGPKLREFRISLTAMSMAFKNALNGVTSQYVQIIKDEKKRLDSRIAALQCIEAVLERGKQHIYLTAPLSCVQSPTDLYRLLISQGAFHVAERVRHTEHGKTIASEAIASSVINIPAQFDPRLYTNWLKDIVIPGLTFNHAILSSIRSWCCHVAEQFDNDDAIDQQHCGIDSSITLLEAVEKAISQLSSRIHSSFVSHTPFINNEDNAINNIPESIGYIASKASLNSSIDSACSSLTNLSSHVILAESNGKRLSPTVMNMEIEKRCKKRRIDESLITKESLLHSPYSSSLRDIDINETIEGISNPKGIDCVTIKLTQAILIKSARELGLSRETMTLDSFEHLGGASFLAKELVRSISEAPRVDKTTQCRRRNELESFCEKAHINMDKAITEHAMELCDSRTNANALQDASNLARLCADLRMRCDVTLKVLRAALLSNDKPSSLTKLANDALAWATDDAVKSEIQEATRLLVIDDIVRRYCGNGAQDFFQVTDMRHGLRLLHHVCRHIDEPLVLTDALSLCDAFTHLSRTEAYVLILQRVVLSQPIENKEKTSREGGKKALNTTRQDQCGIILRQIHELDPKLAEVVAIRVCMFCTDTIGECSSLKNFKRQNQNSIIAASSSACVISSVMADLSPSNVIHKSQSILLTKLGARSWTDLLSEFQRILDLHTNFDITISLAELRRQHRHHEYIKELLKPSIEIVKENSRKTDNIKVNLKYSLAHARRGCSLLFGDDSSELASHWCDIVGSVSCQLAQEADEGACLRMLEASGLLDEMQCDCAYQAIVSIAVSLCVKASVEARSGSHKSITNPDSSLPSMRCIVGAGSLLQEHVIMSCPQTLLPSVVFLSNLTDGVTQVLTRTDCGVGESIEKFRDELFAKSRSRREPICDSHSNVRKDLDETKTHANLKLHSSWYVGDGLLLPPLEALSHCMDYCRELMSASPLASKGATSALCGLYSFLETRGAYNLSLRMLTCAATVSLSTSGAFDSKKDQCVLRRNSVVHLAERSLGGSGTGVTSGKIDSQMAVSHLLSLPLKLAFKTYSRCLPSAMARRDFQTVINLADVGARAGGATSVYEQHISGCHFGWKNQQSFVAQCQQLSAKAHWWKILQHHNVSFDPRRFDERMRSNKDESFNNKKTANDTSTYIVSLVSRLIHGASKSEIRPNIVLTLASDFVTDFELDLDVAPQKYIEFLLSWPGDDTRIFGSENMNSSIEMRSQKQHWDIRCNMMACEIAVKDMLQLLPSRLAKSSVLRRCLIRLEEIDTSGRDFERYTVVLSLYHSELHGLITEQSAAGIETKNLYEELKSIDCRRDALAIIASFFHGKKIEERPLFQKCFLPLPNSLKNRGKSNQCCGVLGIRGGEKDGLFDPLLPLEEYLVTDHGTCTASALSPLCVSLGIPSGYIHARTLMQRVHQACSLGKKVPPFQTDVKPVINRLKMPKDGAELAEWCSTQYKCSSTERLECLELALDLAIRSSTVAEQLSRQNPATGRNILEENEQNALNTVKRLSAAKSALSDKIHVQQTLEKERNDFASSPANSILSRVIEKAQSRFKGEGYMSPECFVENLLLEGSLLTAEATLDESINLEIEDFRRISIAVHNACRCLAEQYSHINLGKVAHLFVRRWLVHGDETSPSSNTDNIKRTESSIPTMRSLKPQILHTSINDSMALDEDDTANFVFDLNSFSTKQEVWCDHVVSDRDGLADTKNVTMEEEPLVFKKHSSGRELSDYFSTRVGLRVAFVMSYTEDFHIDRTNHLFNRDEENIDPNQQSAIVGGNNIKSLHPSSKESVNINNLISDHARYLLRIVFSKHGATIMKGDDSMPSRTSFPSMISDQSDKSTSTRANISNMQNSYRGGKALTFAMRHRALRAACVLCPEDMLSNVIEEENYISCSNSNELLSASSKCCFGAFLAMEIEAMGLALPHSDLVQLSTMHYSSYARALWRDHGHTECHGFKGRFMLLLLELSLRKEDITDLSLVTSILVEMVQLDLPRTMLLACERIASVKELGSILGANDGKVGASVSALTQNLAKRVLVEFSKVPIEQLDKPQCLSFLKRFGEVISSFSDSGFGHDDLPYFINSLIKLVTTYTENDRSEFSKGILELAVNTACHLKETVLRSTAFSNINTVDGGSEILKARFGNRDNTSEIECKKPAFDCSILLSKLEQKLNNDFMSQLAYASQEKMMDDNEA